MSAPAPGGDAWVVTGGPTDVELAAVVAAVAAVVQVLHRRAAQGPPPAPRPSWTDGWGAPESLLRRPLPAPPTEQGGTGRSGGLRRPPAPARR
ncbi:acyl-CoA carboxylase epsilon subunit [Kineococcus sp. SYSU DK005]|uniref:acyl-CoA carboxylase epsilon subunit n=1 Tax=Kineococcus sp. SYSU DK005 TaxID=3383126 RepID=UPI003D7D236D